MFKKRVLDWINLLLGVWLIISPWVLKTTANQASTRVVVILGIAVVVASIWALTQIQARAAEWWNVAFGVILFLVPWIFGYINHTRIAWDSWIVGVAVAVLALNCLPALNRIDHRPHAR